MGEEWVEVAKEILALPVIQFIMLGFFLLSFSILGLQYQQIKANRERTKSDDKQTSTLLKLMGKQQSSVDDIKGAMQNTNSLIALSNSTLNDLAASLSSLASESQQQRVNNDTHHKKITDQGDEMITGLAKILEQLSAQMNMIVQRLDQSQEADQRSRRDVDRKIDQLQADGQKRSDAIKELSQQWASFQHSFNSLVEQVVNGQSKETPDKTDENDVQ